MARERAAWIEPSGACHWPHGRHARTRPEEKTGGSTANEEEEDEDEPIQLPS